MTPETLLSQFRTEVADTVQPYLWANSEIFRYINETQMRFVRIVGGIPDATSAITTIVCADGEEFVGVSPLIMKLRGVIRASDGRAVNIINYDDIEWDPTPLSSSNTGNITTVITGMSANALRLVPIPEGQQTLKLVVDRLPAQIDQTSESFEIDPQHHYTLLEGIKALAYAKQDADTFDMARATTHEQNFVRLATSARRERERREHKHRNVAFSW